MEPSSRPGAALRPREGRGRLWINRYPNVTVGDASAHSVIRHLLLALANEDHVSRSLEFKVSQDACGIVVGCVRASSAALAISLAERTRFHSVRTIALEVRRNVVFAGRSGSL
jgi:hypothetical protein